MKSYVLIANFSLAGTNGLRCREGLQVARPPPSGVGAVSAGADPPEGQSADEAEEPTEGVEIPRIQVAAVLVEPTVDPENVAKGLPAGSEGVETSYVHCGPASRRRGSAGERAGGSRQALG